MRRNARALIFIGLLIVAAGLILGFQTISLGNFHRGGDTLLGLSLGLDLQGGSHLVYQVQPIADDDDSELRTPGPEEMLSVQRIIERRVNSSGLGEPIIQILGDDRLLIQLPGVSDPGRANEIIGVTARLEFKHRKLNVTRDLMAEGVLTADDIISVTAEPLPDEFVQEIQEALSGGGSDNATLTPEALTPAPEVGTAESDEPDQAESATPESATTPEAASTPAAEEEPAGQTESTTPESAVTPEAESTPTAEEEPAESDEPTEPPIVVPGIVVEFTALGAAKFDQVLARLDETLQLIQQGGLHSRLNIVVNGSEVIETELPSALIRRLDDTNRFVFPYPQPQSGADDETPEHDVARVESILGDNATISFIERQGQVDEDFGLGGDNLARAYASLHAQSDQPIINLEFDSTGTRLFGEKTTEIAGNPSESIAIFLDDEELIAPVVRQPITTGVAIIEGGFTLERARDISLLLEGGRLPFPIELIQERDVDAILGADSLAKSVVAGVVGLALVFLFMSLYYRIPGLVASVALLIYTAFVLAIFKVLPVTLTLSGVAATILSIGMAVDANVLIFERMKDELRNGRTLISAINIGFNRAWPAIRDSNVSTLITCGILFYFSNQFGTTIVQGFAVTLAIGVMVSMFSAIVVSRTILRVIAYTRLSRFLGAFVPTGAADIPQQTASAVVQRS